MFFLFLKRHNFCYIFASRKVARQNKCLKIFARNVFAFIIFLQHKQEIVLKTIIDGAVLKQIH